MKKKMIKVLLMAAMTFMLLPATAFAAESVAINEFNFPDTAFRSYVSEEFDTNSNGILSATEIKNAKTIDVSDKGIRSLDGVEYLEKATSLNCCRNQLTGLDVSRNIALTELQCSNNNINSLDVSKNNKLLILDCSNNNLSGLDVSANTVLKSLFCGNNQLGTLDVSKNTKLETLSCNAAGLNNLDISKNTGLKLLYCNDNRLNALDCSNNTKLVYLYCQNNALTSLNLYYNTALTTLYCSNNHLTSLDLINTSVTEAVCNGNSRDMKQTAEGEINTRSFSIGFNHNNVSNCVGGTFRSVSYIYPLSSDGLIVMPIYSPAVLELDDGAEVVTYDYDCGNDITVSFQLNVARYYKVTDIFTDVEDTWYVPYIQYVYDNDLMGGTSATTFEPNSPLTRAMFVQTLYAQAGKPAVSGSTPFTDLTEDWYRNAVCWAYENGIVSGKTETTFAPNDNVSREQLAVMLYAYAGKPGVISDVQSYPDAGEISSYAVDAVIWAVQEGIMSGKDVNGVLYLVPKGQATRAEAATMLKQYIESNTLRPIRPVISES